jgi:hypothetical protein
VGNPGRPEVLLNRLYSSLTGHTVGLHQHRDRRGSTHASSRVCVFPHGQDEIAEPWLRRFTESNVLLRYLTPDDASASALSAQIIPRVSEDAENACTTDLRPVRA